MCSFLTSIICTLSSAFFYVNESVVDMQESPSHDSIVVSQALFSEKVYIREQSGDWLYVTTSDGYSGWLRAGSVVSLPEDLNADTRVSRLVAHIYAEKDTHHGPIRSLPYGSSVKVLDATDIRWLRIVLPDGIECYIQKGDVVSEPKLFSKEDLPAFSQKFLSLPYRWGGRSSFGYDCSGFIQMLYGQIGIHLPRDVKQQLMDSRFQKVSINQLEPGDLIFFGKSKEQIMHMGMYIGDGQFIHSTAQENKPWVRVSSLSDFAWNGNKEAFYPYRTARQLVQQRDSVPSILVLNTVSMNE